MKLFKLLCATPLALALVPGSASAAVIDLTTLFGTWDIQDQLGSTGDFFNNTYLAPVALTAKFTDLYYSGDEYGIYVNGVQVGYAASPPDNQFNTDPDAAYASGLFTKGTISLAAGDVLSFTMARIPPNFPDGTIAVTALPGAVPEPASWALMIGGFAIAGAAMRRRKVAISFA